MKARSAFNSSSLWLHRSPYAGLLPFIVLILAVFVTYSNIYGNTFLFDDEYYIVTNRFLRSWSGLSAVFFTRLGNGVYKVGAFYRPLQIALFVFVYQLGGLVPAGFHLLNVALHATNACLVYSLGRRLGFRPVGMGLAALIWALHPLHVEAVTYMSGTADPLFCFFCLTGLVVLLPDYKPRRIVAAAALFICALLSKETAIIFPGLAAICLFAVSPKRLDFKIYLKLWPLFAVAVIYMGVRAWAMPFDNSIFTPSTHAMQAHAAHLSYRLYTALATEPNYLLLLVWPHDLHLERNFPIYAAPWYPDVMVGAVMLILTIAQLIWGRGKRGVPLSWGLLWFFGAQLPQTGIVVPTNAIFLEHWMYVPSIGLILGVSETVASFLARRRFAAIRKPVAGLGIVISLLLGGLTLFQNATWHDPVRFYENMFRYDDSSRGHDNLGIYYSDQENYPAAIAQFHEAVRISDTYPEPHYNLALALLRLRSGNAYVSEAVIELEKALAINPDFFQADDQLAEIYASQGNKKKESYYRVQSQSVRDRLGLLQ